MTLDEIQKNARDLLASLPAHVTLVAAAKKRTPGEIEAVLAAGVRIIGHNYVQEAEQSIQAIGRIAQWHCIGHLQSNKARKAVALFDRIETVDSFSLGQALHKACEQLGRESLAVLIEINSASEQNKTGVRPEEAAALVRKLSTLERLRIEGLMTMGPFSDDPEDARPAFCLTRELFERLGALSLPRVEMRHLSMGMSDSYAMAIAEGATMVRIGSALFGPR